ncbi:catalase-like [Tetranychus urticae]|uniref:catalase-like n=1 Tax=Tetranychus urticae TaxID=32264 RepID=UPI00077C07E6|nr:catalase-like [Tetranychus urticae]
MIALRVCLKLSIITTILWVSFASITNSLKNETSPLKPQHPSPSITSPLNNHFDDLPELILPNSSPAEIFNLTAEENKYHETVDDEFMSDPLSFSGKHYTRFGGAPVHEKINILTAGKKGPLLMEDITFFEEINHFTRERIPERVVHAKGAGAFGYFEVTNPHVTAFTKASFLSKFGKRTKVAVRFSTVAGSKGSSDTVRDPRGFAVKLYTDEGNFDLMMLNFPVFFVRDPLRFLNLIHSQKKDPQSNLINFDYFWDYISLLPETLHATSYLFTDLGTPDGYRHMHGFSLNTFKLVNQYDKVVFGRWHVLTNQGIRNLTNDVATKLAGSNPDYATEDLFKAILAGSYPSWKVCIQVMTQKQAHKWKHSPFDPTKLWPLKHFPLIEAGKLVLTHNPKNFFADIEQLAFNPANLVPGIEPSTEKVLQGRLVAYQEAQSYRLGTNFFKIPVNKPSVDSVYPNIRDGGYCYDDNGGKGPNYFPNSFDFKKEAETEKPSKWKLPSYVEVKRYDSTHDDNYSQVTKFWEALAPKDRDHLIYNLSTHLRHAKKFIQERFLHHVKTAHPEYGHRLQEALDFFAGK